MVDAGDVPLSVRVALVGNPNCGKTSLFNRLTGSCQKVANYPGATVERKVGGFTAPSGRMVRVLDLPGTYSLSATSADERVTRAVCLNEHPDELPQDVLICVLDSTNLRLHLRFALEIAALQRPMILVLNIADAAAKRGITIDRAKLSESFGVPVIDTVAIKKGGIDELVYAIDRGKPFAVPHDIARGRDAHAVVNELLSACVDMPRRTAAQDDAIDRALLHPVFGPLFLGALLVTIFQAVFAWAAPFQDAIDAGTQWVGTQISAHMPVGPLRDLLVDGVIAGAGGVLVFLPQILFLFFFILVLEESGYLPRAAFLLDRGMVACGLSGRSFIPLLSSFACAVPGIMATRSIPDERDRLTTILVAPLMTCSARLPVYTLLIAAFIPRQTVLGFLNLQGLVLFGLYAGGVVSAMLVALVMRRFADKNAEKPFLLELPSYRLPRVKDVALGLWQRAVIFLRRVGGIILAMSIVIWFLSTFPHAPEGASGPAIDYSFAGMIGHALAPLFAPIGFNWQITVALIPGLAAREVAVSALATVYAVAGGTAEAALAPLLAANWPLATALSMLVWYIFAPQCLSTLAVIRRETGSSKIMWLAAGYLTALAYIASLLTYQIAKVLS